MLITQNRSSCNTVRDVGKKISYTGNLLPNIWYQKLLRACDKSDTKATTILSELFFLHRYNGDTEFQLNFSYLTQKFNFDFLFKAKNLLMRYF